MDPGGYGGHDRRDPNLAVGTGVASCDLQLRRRAWLETPTGDQSRGDDPDWIGQLPALLPMLRTDPEGIPEAPAEKAPNLGDPLFFPDVATGSGVDDRVKRPTMTLHETKHSALFTISLV